MFKIKPLKPALREKKRYIVYEIHTTKNTSMHVLQEQLMNKVQELLGVFLASKAGILPIKYNQKTKRGILRVNHTTVDYIRSCFVLITTLGTTPVQIQTKGVSGILKKAKQQYF